MASTARMRMPAEAISCGVALPLATAFWALWICSGPICCSDDEGTTRHFLTISLLTTELSRLARPKRLLPSMPSRPHDAHWDRGKRRPQLHAVKRPERDRVPA